MSPAPAFPLRHAWWVLAVLVVAAAPHVQGFSAGWISDDAAALAYVHREGPWADWAGPEYGLRIIRFWRPLVTTTLGLQVELTGLSPAPLRAFNLAGHAAGALLAGALALSLGGGRLGALAAGLLAAAFPHVGGTVTWIVGRVDSQTVPLVLGAAWVALRPGRVAALLGAGLAFLACASKELGFVTPLVGAALAWGASGSLFSTARAGAPLAAGAGAAFLLRRLALGAWVGGYPAPPPGPADLAVAARVAATVLAGPLLLVLGLLVLVWIARRLEEFPAPAFRALLAALGAAGLALLPLLQLLADGVLEPQNRRVLFLADALLAVAAGAALGRITRAPQMRAVGASPQAHAVGESPQAHASGGSPQMRAGGGSPQERAGGGSPQERLRLAAAVLAALAVLAVAGLRLRDARADVREWVAAAALADAHVQRARAAVAGERPADEPVLDATFPRVHGGAYCLALGAADRFRAPFEATPRPVWPLRLMFAPHASRERGYVTQPRGNLVWPFGETPRMVPEMPVTVGGRALREPLELDLDVARGGGPMLEIEGVYPASRLEALVYTELGYEVGALGPMPGAPDPDAPGADGVPVRISLGSILRATEAATLADALLLAADMGATRAYLELRAVDDAKGIRSRPIAASRMIPLAWSADLPARLAAE